MIKKNIYFSPSKLNLFLEVLSKRRDGYHNLNSLMCFCNIGDNIEIRESKKFIFKAQGDFANKLNDPDNIIIKAIKKLEFFLKNNFLTQHYFLKKRLERSIKNNDEQEIKLVKNFIIPIYYV